MSEQHWYQALLALRPLFEDHARSFPDLRCVCALCKRVPWESQPGTRSQLHEVEPLLDKLFVRALDYRAETHTIYGNVVSDDKSMDWIFRFYGDKTGAHRFLELAKSAGGCLGKNTDWRFPNVSMQHKHGMHESFWLKALFEAAWNNPEGSPLLADKTKLAHVPKGISHYSVLPIDPFTASVLLIDQLQAGTPSAVGDDDYKDGAWFSRNTKVPPARLRKAAKNNRISKRVRSKTIGGVVCYSVEDATQWWPDDMKKPMK